MIMSKNNPDIAGIILISKTRKTIIDFNKEVNKLGFFTNTDPISYIYEYLDLLLTFHL